MKTARLPFCAMLALLLAWAPAVTAADTEADTDRFLARLAGNLAGVKTVFSEFEQERHLDFLADPLVSRGVIIFRKPRNVRWDTTEPYQSILIANGENVEQFEWMNEKWQRLKIGYAAAMGKVMDSVALTWSENLADQKKDFVFALRTGDETVLTMTPRKADVREFVSAIELHFEKDLATAHSIVLKESSGDVTTIRLRKQHINATLPETCFDPEHPLALEKIRQAIRNEE